MATLEQQRAGFALEKVEGVKDDAERKAKFKTQLLKLPARLHTSGLGQTVAFYLSAGFSSGRPKPEVEICGWLEVWLRKVEIYGEEALIKSITGNTSALESDPERAEALYRQASAEARALAVWLKRFAEAFIEGEGG